MAKELKNLTKRSENYSQWYNELVVKADLAEQSDVRGLRHLGKAPAYSGRKIQRDGRTERVLPDADSKIIPLQRSRTR